MSDEVFRLPISRQASLNVSNSMAVFPVLMLPIFRVSWCGEGVMGPGVLVGCGGLMTDDDFPIRLSVEAPSSYFQIEKYIKIPCISWRVMR